MEMNIFAVLVASIVAMAIGGFWYSPAGFGKLWMKLSGIKMGKPKPGEIAQMYAKGFVTQVITATVLSWFIMKAGKGTVGSGMLIGLMAWLGFVAAKSFGMVLWEKKPIALWILHNVYDLIVLVIMGLILGWWM